MERTSVRSNFHGYETTKVEDAEVISIVKNDEKVDELNEGEEGLIVLDETPFYAEAGGQDLGERAGMSLAVIEGAGDDRHPAVLLEPDATHLLARWRGDLHGRPHPDPERAPPGG